MDTRKVKTPFLAVRQNSHGNTKVKGIFKQLPISPGGEPDFFDLHKHRRLVCRMTKGIIYSAAFNGKLRDHNGNIKYRPSKQLQGWQNNSLGNAL